MNINDNQLKQEVTGGSLTLYHRPDGQADVQLMMSGDSLWMTQKAIAQLFDAKTSTINYHLKEIFASGELVEDSVIRKIRITAADGKKYLTGFYNLDAIIAVGYRVNSKQATQFRIWATDKLHQYLVNGYVANQERLKQLGQVVKIIGRSSNDLLAGTADILAKYIPSLNLLRAYDDGQLDPKPKDKPTWQLTIGEARKVIAGMVKSFPGDALAGNERGDKLEGIIDSIYQSFGGQDLYPTTEEKAANLLYLVVKDHPLSDGNKRSGALLFVTFLSNNNMLYDNSGELRISNNALAALTLMIAMSLPEEKDQMIAMVTEMLS